MKKTFGIIAASAFAIAAISAPVAAAPSEKAVEASCFGQIHKAVNAGFLTSSGIDNVGQLVNSELVAGFGKKGQGKNIVANSLVDPTCAIVNP